MIWTLFLLFIFISNILAVVRKLWPPKEAEFQLPKGCNSLEEYIETCVLWERLTEKQKQECMEWAVKK